MLVTASLLRTRSWTTWGIKIAFGNRDDVPSASPIIARADRAARNMLENLLLLVALVCAAHLAGVPPARIEPGARLFFCARVAYFPVYLVGISYLRTLVWAVGVVGLGMILVSML
jgi:uncharacterized MAPEG superfamily protein